MHIQYLQPNTLHKLIIIFLCFLHDEGVSSLCFLCFQSLGLPDQDRRCYCRMALLLGALLFQHTIGRKWSWRRWSHFLHRWLNLSSLVLVVVVLLPQAPPLSSPFPHWLTCQAWILRNSFPSSSSSLSSVSSPYASDLCAFTYQSLLLYNGSQCFLVCMAVIWPFTLVMLTSWIQQKSLFQLSLFKPTDSPCTHRCLIIVYEQGISLGL